MSDVVGTAASCDLPISINPPPVDRQNLSRATFSNQKWAKRRFKDTNGLKGKFIDCDFSFSIFEYAYFRDAEFTNCQFVGCKFIDCNFKSAKFYRCDIRYAQFHRSLLDAKELVAALPSDPNVRKDGLQNLRANASEIADYASQRLFVLEEIAATKDHLRRIIWGTDSYYKRKYPTILPKLEAAWKLFWLGVSGFVWGNGEQPGNILISGATFLLALTLVNFWSVYPHVEWTQSLGGLRLLQYTVSLFLDVPTDQKYSGFLGVDYAIAFMRYIYIGLYISVLYRKISHR